MAASDSGAGKQAVAEVLLRPSSGDKKSVTVFSKSYCPYCRATKSLLEEVGIKYELRELDQIENGPAMQDYLEAITGQRTVPNVFFDDFSDKSEPAYLGVKYKPVSFGDETLDQNPKTAALNHIGGNSDLQAVKKQAKEWARNNA